MLPSRSGSPKPRRTSVATFYENFSFEAKGKYVIKVCDGTACHVRHSTPVLEALWKELGLSKKKHTTDDMLFTVETVSCLGACGLAPTLMVNEAGASLHDTGESVGVDCGIERERLMIKTCEELNQARVQAQLEIQSYACRILVCSGTGCIATGSHKIHERFEDLVKETPGIELVFCSLRRPRRRDGRRRQEDGLSGLLRAWPAGAYPEGRQGHSVRKGSARGLRRDRGKERSGRRGHRAPALSRRATRSTFSPMKFPSSRSRPGSFWKTAASSTPNLWTSIWPPAALTR